MERGVNRGSQGREKKCEGSEEGRGGRRVRGRVRGKETEKKEEIERKRDGRKREGRGDLVCEGLQPE